MLKKNYQLAGWEKKRRISLLYVLKAGATGFCIMGGWERGISPSPLVKKMTKFLHEIFVPFS